MATEEDVLKVLRYMAAAWPRAELAGETVAVYVIHGLRSGLAAEVLLLAAMALVDTSSWLPTVAEWLTEARRVSDRLARWQVTANSRLAGESLPADLRLASGLTGQIEKVLGRSFSYEQLEA